MRRKSLLLVCLVVLLGWLSINLSKQPEKNGITNVKASKKEATVLVEKNVPIIQEEKKLENQKVVNQKEEKPQTMKQGEKNVEKKELQKPEIKNTKKIENNQKKINKVEKSQEREQQEQPKPVEKAVPKVAKKVEEKKTVEKKAQFRRIAPAPVENKEKAETNEKSVAVRQKVKRTVSNGNVVNPSTEIIKLLNKKRVANGLKPLRMSYALYDAALIRSTELASVCTLRPIKGKTHTRLDGRSWSTVLPRNKYRIMGENLAGSFDINRENAGTSLAHDLFHSWWNSPGHRSNMMTDSFTEIAIAAVHCDNMVDSRGTKAGFGGFIATMILTGR